MCWQKEWRWDMEKRVEIIRTHWSTSLHFCADGRDGRVCLVTVALAVASAAAQQNARDMDLDHWLLLPNCS